MAFTVGFSRPNSKPSAYGDDVGFKVLPNGVLVITERTKKTHVSPACWDWVEETWADDGNGPRI